MKKSTTIKGYLCRSDGYNHLEFYDKMPKRIYGEHINHWTYSEACYIKILPLKLMPELTWEDDPKEVELTLSIKTKN